jgi:transcriptional regulator with XRE-family HTH domain
LLEDATMARPRKPLDLTSVRMAVSERIRRAREYAGMSQEELAHAVGFTAANPICKMELGHIAFLDIGRLAAIARATNVAFDWLVEPAMRAAEGRRY